MDAEKKIKKNDLPDITEKFNSIVHKQLEKDNTSELLAKAIKAMLKKDEA